MADEASSLPHPILVDETYLRVSASAAGLQHDERKSTIAGMWKWFKWIAMHVVDEKRLGWAEGIRKIDPEAPLHPTVIERFGLNSVLAYDETIPYRPDALRQHGKVRHFYVDQT